MRATTVLPETKAFTLRQCPAPAAERRAWVRSGCGLEVACHVPSVDLEVIWPAQVEDISAGGVGLLLSRRFEPGTRLDVELPLSQGVFMRPLQAEVVRVAEHPRGGWLHGCAFPAPLTAPELEAVLKGTRRAGATLTGMRARPED